MKMINREGNFFEFLSEEGNYFAFSYETLIAFAKKNPNSHNPRVYVRKNAWGPTTGKHINRVCTSHGVDRASSEMERDEFEQAYRHLFPNAPL